MKNLLSTVAKTAFLAALTLPYKVEEDESGKKIKALLYEVEIAKKQEENGDTREDVTVTMLPSVKEQVQLAKQFFGDCKDKWDNSENEKIASIKEKLENTKAKLDELKNKVAGMKKNAFDESETFDESDFSEEEFTASASDGGADAE